VLANGRKGDDLVAAGRARAAESKRIALAMGTEECAKT
jgi:hypothetical protein